MTRDRFSLIYPPFFTAKSGRCSSSWMRLSQRRCIVLKSDTVTISEERQILIYFPPFYSAKFVVGVALEPVNTIAAEKVYL